MPHRPNLEDKATIVELLFRGEQRSQNSGIQNRGCLASQTHRLDSELPLERLAKLQETTEKRRGVLLQPGR